jgi:hypothetical protein
MVWSGQGGHWLGDRTLEEEKHPRGHDSSRDDRDPIGKEIGNRARYEGHEDSAVRNEKLHVADH